MKCVYSVWHYSTRGSIYCFANECPTTIKIKHVRSQVFVDIVDFDPFLWSRSHSTYNSTKNGSVPIFSILSQYDFQCLFSTLVMPIWVLILIYILINEIEIYCICIKRDQTAINLVESLFFCAFPFGCIWQLAGSCNTLIGKRYYKIE